MVRSLQENNLKIFSYDELRMSTNDFRNENRIDDFQYGKTFYGTIQDKQVVVKIWQPGSHSWASNCDNAFRLRHPQLICHPNLVELIGYCRKDEHFGIVYDVKALDTLLNLILKDSLSRIQIIKIGIGFASLLEFHHKDNTPLPPYVVCNISASHIMIYQ
ncbi:hypothetical protein Tsubulata_043488, partial [Turnera subulata]